MNFPQFIHIFFVVKIMYEKLILKGTKRGFMYKDACFTSNVIDNTSYSLLKVLYDLVRHIQHVN